MEKGFKEILDMIPNMDDAELKSLVKKIEKTDIEQLDDIMAYVIDEVFIYGGNDNKNAIDIGKLIVKLIENDVCSDNIETPFNALSNDCKIDVIDKLLPDYDEFDELKEIYITQWEEKKH